MRPRARNLESFQFPWKLKKDYLDAYAAAGRNALWQSRLPALASPQQCDWLLQVQPELEVLPK